MPTDQLAKGQSPITWAGGHSLIIPETAKQKEGAFQLIQYICSEEGQRILEQGRHDTKSAEGRLYIPRGLANRRLYESFIKEYVDSNPNLPAAFKQAFATIRSLMPHTLIRPVTPVGQLLWNKHMRAYEAGVRHEYADEAKRTGQDEIALALERNQTEVQQGLDEILNPPPAEVVHWTPYFVLYGLIVAFPFVVLVIAYKRRKKEYGYRARESGGGDAVPFAVGDRFCRVCRRADPLQHHLQLHALRRPVARPLRRFVELYPGRQRSELLCQPAQHGLHGHRHPADAWR